jgi:hypothetical protein
MRRTSIILVSVFLLSMVTLIGSTYGTSIRYAVQQGGEYMYECKYSLYTEDSVPNKDLNNPTNTSAVKFIISRETVEDSNLNSSVGNLYCQVWYLDIGYVWVLVNNNWKLSLNYDASSSSESEELHSNVTILDAQVNKAKIVDFFTSSSFLIPVGLNEAQKTAIGVDITNRLSTAYSVAPSCVRTPNSLNYSFTGVGPAGNLLKVKYSETDGSLMLYELVSSTDTNHIIFRVERLIYNTYVPTKDSIDGFSIPILCLSISVVVVFTVKKKPIYLK